ncbi:Nucleolar protein 16 [Caenorhabditis elegans]|uniref:Nucleolar protein 16 n=1 Tax=Caenorhabditis elegans TaxID=6239 RepID=A0A4V0IJD5_CAEEL|nr:Nucleolar protein 16 [Caenorhabditis elegans]VTW47583.1 Nucleolar protein 16 [Caenorhabditis elegans]
MRSPKSVRRPHIRQQLTNRRKNLGRVAKSQRNQFRQWLLTAVLPNSINDQRKEAFASLELTEQPQQVEKVKKSEKKKAQKQIAKDHEAEQKVNAKKAAEKEARRAEAEAKKRAAQEEEHKQWKAEQERIQKEQEKKEADLKKLQAEKKKEKAVKAEKAEKAEKTKKASTPAPVEEEIVVKKVANDRSAAPAPEPKTPTNTPAEPAEQVQEITGKKNKKNKKKSESEATAAPASVEQVVEQPKVVTEEPHQQAAPQEKKNKKNKRKSESENVPAASETPVEPVVETTPPASENQKKNKKDKKKSESEKVVEEPVQAEAPKSKKPTADDNMDFLDFVTAKEEPKDEPAETPAAPVEEVVENVVENVVEKSTTPPATENKKKNKKDKKKSESEKVTEQPVESAPAPPQVEQVVETTPPASENKKKNKKDKKKSESEKAVEEPVQAAPSSKKPTADDSMDFLDFVTAKPDRSEVAAPVEVAKVDESTAVTSENRKKNKKDKKKSESEKAVEEPVQAAPTSKKPTADDSMDFLDFVTAKEERVEEVAPVQEQVKEQKKSKKSKKTSESESKRPTADDSMDFLDFVTAKPEKPEQVVEEQPVVQEVPKPEEKASKKNKKNKRKSESEKNESPESEPVAKLITVSNTEASAVNVMGFSDIVTPKADEVITQDPVSAKQEVLPEHVPSEIPEEPVAVSKKPTADSMDFLDFVTPKTEAESTSEAPAPVVSKPTESIEDLEIVTYEHVADVTGNTLSPSQHSTPSPNSVLLNGPQSKSSKRKHHHKKNKKRTDSEMSQEPSKEDLEFLEFLHSEPKKVEKPVAPVSKKPTADDNMDFLDFVTAKPEKTESVEEHIEAPMIVEPVHAENETAAAAGGKKKNKKNKNKKNSESESTPAAEPVKEVTPEIVEEVFEKKTITPSTAAAAAPAPGSKKNKKNKKNSESESAPAAEPVKEVTPEIVEEVFEKKTVTPSTEAAAAPASASKKNKKNKKGSGISESHDTAPAPTVEIPQTTEGGKGSPGSDKENSGSAVNGSAKKQMSVEELDYGVPGQTTDTTTDKKNKKKNKKGKNSNSISENAQVIAHLEQDHLDQMADDEVQAITGAAGSHSPPIQVHEVTSSEQHSNGVEKNTTIEITQAVDGTDMSQTQFQKNVEKLVQATLAKHDIVEIDPTVKLRIDAQLIKLSEKKAPAVVMEHVNYIKPLPMELHVSRPSTPSRDRVYKLLPKDIIFCAGLMDSHGENYAAMAADERNIFKDTSRALQRKIRIFKESPHYHTYLRAKEENRPIEEVIAEAQH